MTKGRLREIQTRFSFQREIRDISRGSRGGRQGKVKLGERGRTRKAGEGRLTCHQGARLQG